MKRVAIVGGGLTGLTAAFSLQEIARSEGREISIRVLEAAERFGGKILTEKTDGFLLEAGPDSFITRKPWALELIRELGLGGEVIRTPEENGRVYLLRLGKLVPMPRGMIFVVPTDLEAFRESRLLSAAGKARVLREMVWSRRKPEGEDESLADFVRRRFGEEALARIAEPLMAGIHAADPERLSLRAAFPDLAAADERFPSLIRGLRAAHRRAGVSHERARTENSSRVTLRGGLESLVEALVARIGAGSLAAGKEVTGVTGRQGEGFQLHLADGEVQEADAVVVTTPTHVAAQQLRQMAPELSRELAGIRHVSSATVSLGFPAHAVARKLDGLGFVVPHAEGRRVRACTWSSAKFAGRAPDGHVLLRAFVGGAFAAELVQLDDGELQDLVLGELEDLMGLIGEPVLVRVHRWRRGIPQQELGHLQRVERIAGLVPEGLFLAGNAYGGVGLPDAVCSGRQAAREAAESLFSRDRGARPPGGRRGGLPGSLGDPRETPPEGGIRLDRPQGLC